MQARSIICTKHGVKKTFGNRCLTIKTKTKMKKNLFMVAAVALMAMVSCNKEEVNQSGPEVAPEPSYYVEFTAQIDNEETPAPSPAPAQTQTKTTYDESNKKTLWENKDEISVNGKKFYTTELADDGLSARFINFEELGEFGKPYVAVTPYQSSHAVNGTTVSGVVLKSEQTATSASFESNAVIAMAYNADGNVLAFKNACSIVKFKVGTANVKEVTITSNNGENLAGTVTLDYNNGEPTATVTANGTSTIKLAGDFNTTSTYYVAVLASGLENGITISLDGTIAKTVANELAFKRNIVMNAGTLSLPLTVPGKDMKVYLRGEFNTWSENTPMYYESGLFVARNVALKGGFKVNTSDGTWYASDQTGETSLNAWFSLSTDGNLTNMQIASASGEYDVYINTDDKKMYITSAGSPRPSIWGVWVDGTSKDYVMTQVGQYYVAKSVTLAADKNFKFRTYGDWTTNKGYGTVSAKIAYSLSDGGDNMNTSTAGTYDIYLTANAAYGFIVPAGHSLNDSDIKLDKMDISGCIDDTYWKDGHPLYICGDYFGLKGVDIKGDYLFRVNDWSAKWGLGSFAGLNEKSTLSKGGSDITGTNGDNRDIYVNHDFTNFWIMEAGKKPAN